MKHSARVTIETIRPGTPIRASYLNKVRDAALGGQIQPSPPRDLRVRSNAEQINTLEDVSESVILDLVTDEMTTETVRVAQEGEPDNWVDVERVTRISATDGVTRFTLSIDWSRFL